MTRSSAYFLRAGGRKTRPAQGRRPRACRETALVEALEPRLLLSAADPSGDEQQLLWLMNRMRANPAAELKLLLSSTDPYIQEALTYFHVNTSTLAQQWALLKPAQPLDWNADLGTSAAGHNVAMQQADTQAHQLPGEPSIGQRFQNAGYAFAQGAENIYAFAFDMIHCHAGFAIDWGNGPGGIQDPADHRIDMMNGAYRDVGIGVLESDIDGHSTGPYIVTEDFGVLANPGDFMLVGTTYQDINKDGSYEAGEGLGGVSITATGAGGTFTTTSMTAGGYQIALPAGSYKVTFTTPDGAPMGGASTISINGQNVLLDRVMGEPGAGSAPPATDTAIPIGHLDQLAVWPNGEPRMLTGWALDVDAGNNGVVQVRLDIDGHVGTPIDANAANPGLAGKYASIDHGFSISVPALTPGRHVLKLVAIDAPTGKQVMLARRAISFSSRVFGAVSAIDSSGTLRGWAFEPARPDSPVQVRVQIDRAPMTKLFASTSRSDLQSVLGSTDHGFVLTLPALKPGSHVITLFAVASNGTAVRIGRRTIRVNAPALRPVLATTT